MGTLVEGNKYMTNLRNIQQIRKKRNSDKPLEKQEVVLVKIGPCRELQFSALLGTTAWPSSILAQAGLDQEMVFSAA